MLLVVALCCALVAGLEASPISPQREIIPLNAEAFAQPEYVQALAKELEKEGTTTESSPRIRRNLDQIGGGNLLREEERTSVTLELNELKAADFSSHRSKRGYPVHVFEPVFPTLFGITKLTTTTTTVAPKKYRDYHYIGGNLDHIGGGNLLRKKVVAIPNEYFTGETTTSVPVETNTSDLKANRRLIGKREANSADTTTTTTAAPKVHKHNYDSRGTLDSIGGGNLIRRRR